MLDLDAMRAAKGERPQRDPVKTYMTYRTRERLRAAAAQADVFEYEVIEALIEQFLPPARSETEVK